MTASIATSPTSQEVRDRVLAIQRKHPGFAVVSTVGTTADGRPIDAVTLTDPRESAADKQHVLIVAGQHGNEESARLVALKLIDYLLGAEGRPLLKRQRIVIMPNVSPDAAESDAYETPAGIKPNLDHGPDGPTSPEAKAVQQVAEQLMPDVYVDMHARGHAGWSHDMVLFPEAKAYTEDEHLLHTIASAMAAEGEKSGIPHVIHPLSWPGWGTSDFDQPSSTMYMYRRFKSRLSHREFGRQQFDLSVQDPRCQWCKPPEAAAGDGQCAPSEAVLSRLSQSGVRRYVSRRRGRGGHDGSGSSQKPRRHLVEGRRV